MVPCRCWTGVTSLEVQSPLSVEQGEPPHSCQRRPRRSGWASQAPTLMPLFFLPRSSLCDGGSPADGPGSSACQVAQVRTTRRHVSAAPPRPLGSRPLRLLLGRRACHHVVVTSGVSAASSSSELPGHRSLEVGRGLWVVLVAISAGSAEKCCHLASCQSHPSIRTSDASPPHPGWTLSKDLPCRVGRGAHRRAED